jgi:hypothetical protein
LKRMVMDNYLPVGKKGKRRGRIELNISIGFISQR